jgi:uncharacterized phiE125 gp8 family phage protein
MIYPLSLSHGEPSEYPLTLSQIKAQLRIQHDEFDPLIVGIHLPAALSWAEGETGRSIALKQYRWTLDRFPTSYTPIRLPMGQAQSVVSIAYVTNGGTVTLRGPTSGSPIGADYQEDLTAPYGGLVMPIADATWPLTDTDIPAPVVVTFTAGWAAANVPADLKMGMLRYISDQIDSCEDGDHDLKDRIISGWKLR